MSFMTHTIPIFIGVDPRERAATNDLIPRCGHAVAHLIPNRGTDRPADPTAWGARPRRMHADHPRPEHSAVELVCELREEP